MKTFKQFITEKIELKEDADSQYEKFFQKKLKAAGYDSPEDIPDDKKDEFFDMIDKEWKADDE